MPTDATAIRREHVETCIEAVSARWKPITALTRYRDLQQPAASTTAATPRFCDCS